jgi:hypothetical protein
MKTLDVVTASFRGMPIRLRQLFPSEPPNAVVNSEPSGQGKGADCAALRTLAREHGSDMKKRVSGSVEQLASSSSCW